MEGVSRPLDVSNIEEKNQTSYCKASKYLNDKGKEREEKREVRRKRWFKKERKMVDERESGRKEEENKDPTPLRIEVKPQPTPPAAEVKTLATSSFIKSSVKETLLAKRASRHLPPLASKTRPPSTGEEPMLVQKVSQHPALPAIEVKPLPGSSFIKSSEEEPPLSVANFAPKATETKPLHGSFVVDPEVVQKASRQLAQPATELLPVPHEPTPKQVIYMSSSTSSKSPEEEPPMVQRASRTLIPPAIKNIPLQSGAKPSMLQRTSRHFAPKPTGNKSLCGYFVLESKINQMANRHLAPPADEASVVVPHKPTESLSHSMEEQLMEQVMLPSRQIPKCAEVKPKSTTSSLIPIDTESEEDESVEHTERNIPSSESETNHKQTLEARVKQKPTFEKVHPIVLEQSDDSEKKKCGDSKAEALRKAKELDEQMTKLFCVDYRNVPKKESRQHLKLKNQQALEAGVKQKAVFEKVHPIVLEQSNESEKKKCGDSKAEALRKAKELDEQMTKLFCVDHRNVPKKESQQHLKLKNQQALEAGVKQKAVFEKVHPIVLEQSDNSEKKKCGDSKAEALRKAKELDEQMTKLFCVDYSPCPKKEKQQPSGKGQKKPKKKGKTRAGPFSWAEKKLKRINEEKEESDKDENT